MSAVGLMTHVTQHDYHDGVSHPYRERVVYDRHDHRMTRSREKLYGDALVALSRDTDRSIEHAQRRMMLVDPCRAYGMIHGHPECRVDSDADKADAVEYRDDAEWPKWSMERSMFSTDEDRVLSKQRNRRNDVNAADVADNHCYLCTTLDEHEQHHLRGPQHQRKTKPKPRIRFIPPPPAIKVKKKEREEKNEVLYRVDVITGRNAEASTAAEVTIQIEGKKGLMNRRVLKKSIGVNFVFRQGTTETFYIKGPDIGDLKLMAVEHNGTEKKHSWFLEYVEVTNMNTEQVWVFPCGKWLSLYIRDPALKRVLRAHTKEVEYREYEVTTFTGDLRDGDTTSNVYITVYGRKGVTKKMQLKSNSKHPFSRASKDKFVIATKDNVFPISKIRVEHDNSGASPGWFLEKVVMHDLNNGRDYMFPCGRWLATNKKDRKTSVDLCPIRGEIASTERNGKVVKGPSIKYEVTVLTGTARYGGTDAHVYIQLLGKLGRSSEIELNEGLDHFEQGQTDEFKVRIQDVGDIKKLFIRHDNTGLGAGWYLEKITIRRFFSPKEVRERLKTMGQEIDETIAKHATGHDLTPRGRDSPHSDRKSKSGRSRRKHSPQSDDGSDSDRSRKSRKSVTWSHSHDDSDDDDQHSSKSRRHREKDRYREHDDDRRRGRHDDDDDSNRRQGRSRRSGGHGSKHGKRSAFDDVSGYDSDVYVMGQIKLEKEKKRRSKYFQDSYSSDDGGGDDDDGRIDLRRYRKNAKHSKHTGGGAGRKTHRHGSRHSASNLHSEDSSESDNSTSSDSSDSDKSESETDNSQHSDNRTSGRHSVMSEESETLPATAVWKENRIPYFDEYLFVCQKWLALDEDDGKLERTFKPKTITTFFRVADD